MSSTQERPGSGTDRQPGAPEQGPRTSEEKSLDGYDKGEPIVLNPKGFVDDVAEG